MTDARRYAEWPDPRSRSRSRLLESHSRGVDCQSRTGLFFMIIIRPHRSTTYVDAARCYRLSSVVCRSVCLTHWWALQKWQTDRDAVWVEDSGGPKEPCIRWGSRSPMERVISNPFWYVMLLLLVDLHQSMTHRWRHLWRRTIDVRKSSKNIVKTVNSCCA